MFLKKFFFGAALVASAFDKSWGLLVAAIATGEPTLGLAAIAFTKPTPLKLTEGALVESAPLVLVAGAFVESVPFGESEYFVETTGLSKAFKSDPSSASKAIGNKNSSHKRKAKYHFTLSRAGGLCCIQINFEAVINI